MKRATRFGNILLILATLVCGPLMAQNTVVVNGQMTNTGGAIVQVNISTAPGVAPPVFNTVFTNASGMFMDTLNLISNQGSLIFSFTDCDSTVVSDTIPFVTSPLGGLVAPVFDYCPNLVFDCLGVPGGTALPGTPCDDGDSTTVNDTWDPGCTCVGTPITNPCNVQFSVFQAFDTVLLQPIPSTLYVLANGPMASSGYQYQWDFGDGNSSTEQFPSHTYTGNGPYILCVTVTSFLCSSSYCDTVEVDPNGIIVPGQSPQGFTINVLGSGPNSIDEQTNDVTEVLIAPNPVYDRLNISFSSRTGGTAEILVFSASGQLIAQERKTIVTGMNRFSNDALGLEPGSYVVRIEANGAVLNKRFVKVTR